MPQQRFDALHKRRLAAFALLAHARLANKQRKTIELQHNLARRNGHLCGINDWYSRLRLRLRLRLQMWLWLRLRLGGGTCSTAFLRKGGITQRARLYQDVRQNSAQVARRVLEQLFPSLGVLGADRLARFDQHNDCTT